MLKPVAKAIVPTFEELKERGDRAIDEGKVAAQMLRAAVIKSQELRQHVDEMHHGNGEAKARWAASRGTRLFI